METMTEDVRCVDEDCTECEAIVTRAYRDLRDKGYMDRDAFMSSVRVLEVRHPGHDRYYYFYRIANWLAAVHEPPSPR
jgi:hypothetical protein